MPTKFLIREHENKEEEKICVEEFNKKMNEIKIPEMLLERLKKEFDENYKIAARSSAIENNANTNNNPRHSSVF